MPDITMCQDHQCKLKENCYRYNAMPSKYDQSYFVNSPYNKQEDNCQYFWDSSHYQKVKDENKITD